MITVSKTSAIVYGRVADEMVVCGDIVHVVVYLWVHDVLMEEIDRDEELAIISTNLASSISHSLWSPQAAVVTIITMIILIAVRVSKLYKPDFFAWVILNLFHAQDSVGVSIIQAHCVCSIVGSITRITLHDVMSCITSL